MKPLVLGSIMDHYNSGDNTINEIKKKDNNSLQSDENDTDVIKQIKELLDTRKLGRSSYGWWRYCL